MRGFMLYMAIWTIFLYVIVGFVLWDFIWPFGIADYHPIARLSLLIGYITISGGYFAYAEY